MDLWNHKVQFTTYTSVIWKHEHNSSLLSVCLFCFRSRTTACPPPRPASSSSVCLRTPTRPSWLSGCATPSTTAVPSTWTTTCSHVTWTMLRAPTPTTDAQRNTLSPRNERACTALPERLTNSEMHRHHCTNCRELLSWWDPFYVHFMYFQTATLFLLVVY